MTLPQPSTQSTTTDLRIALLENGYLPLPIGVGKRPPMKGWTDIRATQSAIKAWERGYSDCQSTGILTGDVVAIDVDALDAAIAEKLADTLLQIPGAENAPCRTGMAPRCLYVFRARVPREKRATAEYFVNSHKCQVEVLGCGQQFVAYGIHDDTGMPYSWAGGEPALMPFAELPEITPDEIDAFLGRAEAILAAAGTPRNSERPKQQRLSGGGTFWTKVNTVALANADAWVPSLFNTARKETGTGAWRVSSRDLGRSLQEDISIHRDGVQDFGEEKSSTPIQLVQDYGDAASPKDAAHWLCERLGKDPAEFGWDQQASGVTPAASLTAKAKIPAPANDNRSRKDDRRKVDPKPFPGVVHSGDFVRDFVPPDYHIDGIAQAAFFYSLTGMTGAGKTAVLLLIAYCTALGKRLGDREVRKGRVIYSAGENPVDVRMRWIGMSSELGFDPDTIDVHFIPGTYSIPACIGEIRTAAEAMGGVDLVIIDTSAAYFQGDDENANVQMGAHARDMRALTELPGAPCVFVAAHPVKNATADNLLPKGGGSFLNEVDGNLTLAKAGGGARMHWQGKHRGADFEPVEFVLESVNAPRLIDSKGRAIPTVLAKALTSSDAYKNAETARRDEDDVLLEIERDGSQSLKDMAERLGWQNSAGEPDKRRVSTATDKLKRDKLAGYSHRRWKLTMAGQDAATDIKTDRHTVEAAARLCAGLVRKRRGENDLE